jgi:PhnB protein
MADQQQGVIPHLVVDNAAAALEFYKKALGASEVMRMPAEDGKRLMHAELNVNGARVFVRDHFPEFCSGKDTHRQVPPKELTGTTVALHLEVPNCDAAIKRASDAGARVSMPAEDTFWGARYGQVVDPFGHAWSFAHPLPGNRG